MLIAMAGLPGTGKTTVANALAAHLGAVVLSKDATRAALFPPETIVYSAQQDDLCFSVMLQAAAFLLSRSPDRPVILDGRTFSGRGQVVGVVQAALKMDVPLVLIECTCSEATALQRLALDQALQNHIAGNRDADLYRKLKTSADPLDLPHLVVDTDTPLACTIKQCLAYLASHRPSCGS